MGGETFHKCLLVYTISPLKKTRDQIFSVQTADGAKYQGNKTGASPRLRGSPCSSAGKNIRFIQLIFLPIF